MLRSVSRSSSQVLVNNVTTTNCPACLELVKVNNKQQQLNSSSSSSTNFSTSRRSFTSTASSSKASTSLIPLNNTLVNRNNSLPWTIKNNSNNQIKRKLLSTDARVPEVDLEGTNETYEELDMVQDSSSELERLLDSIELEDNNSTTSFPLSSLSSSIPSSTPTSTPAARPVSPPVPKITSQTLLTKRSLDYSSPPTHQDLDNCRPRRRVVIPTFDSVTSVRIIYKKNYEQAINRISSSFNKAQIAIFVGATKEKGGLGLDLKDAKINTAFVGKKPKYWKCKTVEQMSKNDLIKVIMALSWGMPHPDNIVAPAKTPPVTINIPLPDRTLFLLLTPDSTVMATLSKTYGIKLSFNRDPKTSALFLVLKGGKESVTAAQEEVDTIAENCQRRDIELPGLSTFLRPEIYQAISRIGKAYLEPGPTPNTLTATARNSEMIDSTENLLMTAFSKYATQSSTPIFASLSQPIPPDQLKYAMYPFAPSSSPSWLAGATNYFSRIRSVSKPDSAAAADEDFTNWANKLNFNSVENRLRRNLDFDSSIRGGNDLIKNLLEPFTEAAAGTSMSARRDEIEEEEEKEVLELRGSFGHIVWPIYHNQNKDGQMAMGPVLSGEWNFRQFEKWLKTEPNLINNFMPAPPAGFLNSTGVTTPIENSSPFAAILAGTSSESSSESELGPKTVSREFRRVVYTPLASASTASNKGVETLEIEIEGRGDEEVVVSRILVKRGLAQVLVPAGACDFQLVVSRVTTLPESSDLSTTTMHDAPAKLNYNGRIYLLDSNRLIHLTVITPPTKSAISEMLSISPTPTPQNLTYVQERWSELYSSAKGVNIEVLLGDNKPSSGFGKDLSFSDKCQKGLEVMEVIAKIPYVTVADTGLNSKVLRAKSSRETMNQ